MDEEICDGVKVLCERMENNPEDFTEGPIDPNTFSRAQGKFYYDGRNIEGLARNIPDAVEAYWHLNQAERDALVLSYKKMMRGEFTRRVVEKLLEQPEPAQEIRYTAPSRGKSNAILTTAAMQNASLRLLNESFDEAMAGPSYVKYKAKDRYAIAPEEAIKKWATE